MPKGAAVLLILAGVASLLGPFPPVGLLSGLALAWLARSARPGPATVRSCSAASCPGSATS